MNALDENKWVKNLHLKVGKEEVYVIYISTKDKMDPLPCLGK